jgi:hypothetical protein
MKGFSQFFSEATESQAVMQAKRLGLTTDGHGGWYDKDGEFVAKTEKGRLKFYNQNQRVGKQDPPQQRTANNQQPVATQTKTQTQPAQQQGEPQVEPQGDFGTFADGTPRRMPAPTNADGSPKEDRGEVTLTFGRFNVPTTGHEKLFQQAQKAAGKGDLRIYPSRSVDPKKNPLDPDEKIELMQKMFPDYSKNIVNDPNIRTVYDALKQAHQDGYTKVRVVVGADRVKEFSKADSYNGKIFDFTGMETVSAGERDADAEGIEGMSASKMRKAAAENDFKTFRSGMPKSIDDKEAKLIMATVRRKMKVEEGWNLWEIAPKLDWKNLRENYFNKNLFDIGELVENLNTGLVGRVIRRGANYLICVTEDNIMFKSWIKDVSEAVVNNSATSGVTAHKREVGTDSHREYVMNLMGVKEIKNFINKYRKKTT